MSSTTYYTTGQFMKLAHVTKKTLRYYDEHQILKPSRVNEHGNRFYTDEDLAKMQQILLLKYLGFSLSDIREMTLHGSDAAHLTHSLKVQERLVADTIDRLQIVAAALHQTTKALAEGENVDWSGMLTLVQKLGMEQSLRKQYQDATNISARIHLHARYSENPQGWFSFIYEQCEIHEGMRILELGCGDGSFWKENLYKLPSSVSITLTDISEGMLRDAARCIGTDDSRFSYQVCDCRALPFSDDSFDLVLANHVLFYCEDPAPAIRDIARVLRPDGRFLASTYSAQHMKEVSDLAMGFDDRIRLSADRLYTRFGKENGAALLSANFSDISYHTYPDRLFVTDAEDLIAYILSCHGNQSSYITDRYKDFEKYVQEQTAGGFAITKDAGAFIASLPKV